MTEWRLLFLFLMLASNAQGTPLHLAAGDQEPAPGWVALIPLGGAPEAPAARFDGRRVLTMGDTEGWVAVVGIPLDAPAGEYRLTIDGDSPRTLAFQVREKPYPEQRIVLKDQRMVDPGKKDLERIAEELKRIRRATSLWREAPAAALPLSMPVKGQLSSPFGLRRFFNDQPRKPHSGLDIAAAAGTPVRAPADGVVIESGNFFFNGNVLYVDHGQGLITTYAHLNERRVRSNETVRRGQILGTVGATGRVTGPHLHWGVVLNGTAVDPLALLAPAASRPTPRRAPETR